MNFPDGSVGKETAYTVGDKGDTGSIPGLGRLPKESMAKHSSCPAWKTP